MEIEYARRTTDVGPKGISRRATMAGGILGSLLLIAGLAVLDYWTGPDLSFAVHYLSPVSLAARFTGKVGGFLAAVGGALAWVVADVLTRTHSLPGLVSSWNFASRCGVFLAFVSVMDALRRSRDQERDQARMDPVTRGNNRRTFYERAALELARARRYGRPLTIAYLDLVRLSSNWRSPMDQRLGSHTGLQ